MSDEGQRVFYVSAEQIEHLTFRLTDAEHGVTSEAEAAEWVRQADAEDRDRVEIHAEHGELVVIAGEQTEPTLPAGEQTEPTLPAGDQVICGEHGEPLSQVPGTGLTCGGGAGPCQTWRDFDPDPGVSIQVRADGAVVAVERDEPEPDEPPAARQEGVASV